MKDQDRVQCEHIASVLYDQIDRIQSESLQCGQVQQCEESVKAEFVEQVANIIQKELGR